MKWDYIIQGSIILSGLFIGMHFSKVAYAEHEKLGHSDLKAHTEMDHGNLDLSAEEDIPKIIDFKVIKDPMSGWNVFVDVQHFKFNPSQASQAHVAGEGHAHLYINGNKIARMYDRWFHIPELIKDKNEIRVTLNSNDHQTFTIGGRPIEKTILLEKD